MKTKLKSVDHATIRKCSDKRHWQMLKLVSDVTKLPVHDVLRGAVELVYEAVLKGEVEKREQTNRAASNDGLDSVVEGSEATGE